MKFPDKGISLFGGEINVGRVGNIFITITCAFFPRVKVVVAML